MINTIFLTIEAINESNIQLQYVKKKQIKVTH